MISQAYDREESCTPAPHVFEKYDPRHLVNRAKNWPTASTAAHPAATPW
jgi:hypothetical protein